MYRDHEAKRRIHRVYELKKSIKNDKIALFKLERSTP